jgi:tRNA/tmRNA/rRNA uracil-C5-methylase (TrmA/RlmC/RlmD family)
MLAPGQQLDLVIEKPATGGRMIARHEGQVVLVLGAIPGERVRARVDRVERQLAFASTVEVTDPSPDRREGVADPLCGGCLYSHIAYPRQLDVKADVIRDAFLRLGRIPLGASVTVAGSPDRAYRMRARFHVHGRRAGFYREGTHTLCDPATTGQLAAETVRSVQQVLHALADQHASAVSIEVTENISGDQRVAFVQLEPGASVAQAALSEIVETGSLTGCIVRTAEGIRLTAGASTVSDPLASLTHGRASHGELHRGPESFFQANRFLLADLAVAVLDAISEAHRVLDLYAGVGLFSVARAAVGWTDTTAVEGDRTSGADLQRNAAQFPAAVHVVLGRVEDYLRRSHPSSDTIVVDPPRTGISRDAMRAIAGRGARRMVYVSCDPATMARDARRLIDTGYQLESLRAFDLFPNTPHVEGVGVFDKAT